MGGADTIALLRHSFDTIGDIASLSFSFEPEYKLCIYSFFRIFLCKYEFRKSTLSLPASKN